MKYTPEQQHFFNILQQEFGEFPREVMDILILNRCHYILALAGLTNDMCQQMLQSAGLAGASIGVQAVLRALPPRIRENEAYFLSQLRQTPSTPPPTTTPRPIQTEPPQKITKSVEEQMLVALKRLIANFLNNCQSEKVFTKDDIIAFTTTSKAQFSGTVRCEYCKIDIAVSSRNGKSKMHWIISNFQKHCKRKHLIQSEPDDTNYVTDYDMHEFKVEFDDPLGSEESNSQNADL